MMKNTSTVTLSAEHIRARVYALRALHVNDGELPVKLLGERDNAAINRTIVGSFVKVMLPVASYVNDFEISPEGYFRDYENDLLQLVIRFNQPVEASLVAHVVEEAIVSGVMSELYGGYNPDLLKLFKQSADELRSALGVLLCGDELPRLTRSF